MKNIKIISSVYEMDELMAESYAHLESMYVKGKEMIGLVEEAKQVAIDNAEMKNAITLTRQLIYLETNVDAIGVAMLSKESDMVIMGSIETIYLN